MERSYSDEIVRHEELFDGLSSVSKKDSSDTTKELSKVNYMVFIPFSQEQRKEIDKVISEQVEKRQSFTGCIDIFKKES